MHITLFKLMKKGLEEVQLCVNVPLSVQPTYSQPDWPDLKQHGPFRPEWTFSTVRAEYLKCWCFFSNVCLVLVKVPQCKKLLTSLLLREKRNLSFSTPPSLSPISLSFFLSQSVYLSLHLFVSSSLQHTSRTIYRMLPG